MKKEVKTYYYKGNKLYNVRKLSGMNFCGHDLMANWKDKDEDNKEKLGEFYLKDLITEEEIKKTIGRIKKTFLKNETN